MKAKNRQDTRHTGGERHLVLKAMRDLESALKDLYAGQSPEMVIYGSQARGDATPESDIDVILVYSAAVQPGREIRRVSGVLSDLNLRYGVLVSVLPVSRADYLSGSSPFWMNVRREGVRLDAI